MINDTLHFLADELNKHLLQACELSAAPVIVSPLTNADGSLVGAIENKLVLTLVNIAIPVSLRNEELPSSGRGTAAPLSNVLMAVLLSANFNAASYGEGMKILSAGMLFLQQYPLFHLPAKPPASNGTRFTVELNNISAEENFYLWSKLGARYQPSVNYTIRTVL